MIFFPLDDESGMSSFVKDDGATLAGDLTGVFFAGDTFFTVGFATVFVAGATVVFLAAVVVFFAVDFFGAAFFELVAVFLVAVFFLGSAIRRNE